MWKKGRKDELAELKDDVEELPEWLKDAFNLGVSLKLTAMQTLQKYRLSGEGKDDEVPKTMGYFCSLFTFLSLLSHLPSPCCFSF